MQQRVSGSFRDLFAGRYGKSFYSYPPEFSWFIGLMSRLIGSKHKNQLQRFGGDSNLMKASENRGSFPNDSRAIVLQITKGEWLGLIADIGFN